MMVQSSYLKLGGTTKSIVDDPTKFLGKLIDVLVHCTKIKAVIDRFTPCSIKLTKCVCVQSTKFGFTEIMFCL